MDTGRGREAEEGREVEGVEEAEGGRDVLLLPTATAGVEGRMGTGRRWRDGPDAPACGRRSSNSRWESVSQEGWWQRRWRRLRRWWQQRRWQRQ